MNQAVCYVDIERVKSDKTHFQCLICLQLGCQPQECQACGGLFGTNCLNLWQQKKKNCPKCRSEQSKFKPIRGALLQLYNDLDVSCKFENCNLKIKLCDLYKHEMYCQQSKCQNFDFCQKLANPVPCKNRFMQCALHQKVLKHQSKEDQLREILEYKDQIKKMIELEYQQKLFRLENQQQNQPINNDHNQILEQKFHWSYTMKGSNIEISQNNSCAILQEISYVFKTIIADKFFESGVHYWEIIGHEITENEMKIGVTTEIPSSFDKAFCDFNYGFAFYSLGQLRNGSNVNGYFCQIDKRKLGVLLDMNKGTLSFGLYYYQNRDGEFWGIGFTNPLLKKAPVYPAIAMLHKAGCTIDSNVPIPISFRDALQ